MIFKRKLEQKDLNKTKAYFDLKQLYKWTFQFINNKDKSIMQFLQDMACGTISGVGYCLSGYILDTLKVRMQMDHSLTMKGSFNGIVKNQGFLHLFSGMYYPFVTIPIINAIIFSSYELYKKLRNKSELSFVDGIQNGAFAGLVNTIVVSPVELVKCRMQLDKQSKFARSSDCAKAILKKEGIRGLFQGSYATGIREVFCYSAQFATYQFMKQKIVTKDHPNLNFVQGLLVGGVAGINCWVFSYPQDIVKTMLQVSQKGRYKANKWLFDGGFYSCAKEIFKDRGWKGFWIGIEPCLIRAAVANGIGIALYEQSQHFFTHSNIRNY